MPPIVPRLNITFVERGIETDLQEVDLTLETVLTEGTEKSIVQYLESVKDHTLDDLFQTMKTDLLKNHQQLSQYMVNRDKGMELLLKKNLFFLEQQLEFLNKKIEARTKEKYDIVVRKYERIQQSLYPLHSPQERIWNIFYYLKKIRTEFCTRGYEAFL